MNLDVPDPASIFLYETGSGSDLLEKQDLDPTKTHGSATLHLIHLGNKNILY